MDLARRGVNTRWRKAGPFCNVVNGLMPHNESTRVMTKNLGNEPPTYPPARGTPFGEPEPAEAPAAQADALESDDAPPPSRAASFIPSWNHAGLND